MQNDFKKIKKLLPFVVNIKFNVFHTVVLKINLLVAVKHNKYRCWLQDVFYKIQKDDMFR